MTPPSDTSLHVHFVGNATVLLRYRDLVLLTDPNFLHRDQYAYLGYGLFTRRLTEPDVDPDHLPADIHAVVLSHLHGDHWDRVARRCLDRSLPVVTTPHAAKRLRVLHGFPRARGLRTWQAHTVTTNDTHVRVTAMPGRHGRGALGLLLPPVMGSLLEFGPRSGPPELRLYISGDTLMADALEEIGRRYPDVDLALLHLGGTTLPGGFLATMDGAQGAELAARVRPRLVMPIHYDDYTVMKSPLAAFLAEADKRGLSERIVHCHRGQKAIIPTAGPPVTVVS
ncbi:MBL fold metallo-hydrolase [Actinacidiphila glaucinigra]|uniref:MBL fold metallo-hydrolase n=1 Tax=Actinacidiphila glaucinigra TaxID=235986 RepID=UPI0033BA09BE